MYSPSIIRENLTKAQQKLSFSLKLYPIQQSLAYKDHLQSLLDEEGNLTRDLHKDELEFIQNERIICKHHFQYFLERYCWIESTLGSTQERVEKTTLFNPNVAQKMVLSVWSDLESQRLPIMLMELKARQLGVTSLTAMAIMHRAQFHMNTNALMASSTEAKSWKVAHKMEFSWSKMPFYLMPQDVKLYTQGETLVKFPSLNSAITVQWGNKITGIARGETPDVCLLSEVPEWTCDPAEAIDAALMNAIHENPQTFMVWESTAAGMGDDNWWYQKWKYYTDEWSRGTARMRPIFLSWFVGTDVWPTKTWIAKHQHLLDTWQFDPLTIAHAKRAKAYVSTEPLLLKFLGKDWQMPKHQMLFWELERKEKKATKKLNLFYQEMPADPDEAFQTSNLGLFDIDEIIDLKNKINEPKAIYAIEGTGIPDRFHTPKPQLDQEQIEKQKNRVLTKRCNFTNDLPFEFKFLPLKKDEYLLRPENRLYVWNEPEDEAEYVIGVDTSQGLGQDASAVEVVKKATLVSDAVQVAEFTNSYMNSRDIVPIVLAIALYYTVRVGGEITYPKLAIECNADGEATQHELKPGKIGYPRFHLWERYDSRGRCVTRKLGWFTNAWSRPMLVDSINNAIRDEIIQLNSYWLIMEELRNIEKDPDRVFVRAAQGTHDDRYMALGIAFFVAHAWDVLLKRKPDILKERERVRNLPIPKEDWDGEIIMDMSLPTLKTRNPITLEYDEDPEPSYQSVNKLYKEMMEEYESEFEALY